MKPTNNSNFEKKKFNNKVDPNYDKNNPMNKSLAKKKTKVNRKSLAFWWRHFIEFLRTTGFHGYKYIAMESEPPISRIIWAIAVAVCLVVAIILVVFAWTWIATNPTITVIETTHYPIWKFRYPAVTVCPLNLIKKSALRTNLRSLDLPDNDTIEDLSEILKSASVLLGSVNLDEETNLRFKKIQRTINANNISIVDFMDLVRPKCNDMLTRCSWKGSPTRCNSLFQEIKTASGLCCSFNYYAPDSTSTTDKKSFFLPKKPRKVAGCGYQTALSVLLDIAPDEYFTTSRGIYGYKVMVHYAYDYPDENASNKYIDQSTENFFGVIPEMTYSTKGIYGFTIKKRSCLFPNERKLKGFLRYTYNNCIVDCRSNFVYDMCGCIPLFLPNNGSYPVCNFSDVLCPYKARDIFYSATPTYLDEICDCLPDCQHYSYPLELSTGKLVPTNEYNSFSFFKDIKITNHSLVHVYFNDLVATRFRTDVFMNWHNLLASFGGLLGLFIGFSLVSGFEFVYFFTLRVFFDIVHVNDEKPINNNNTVWSDSNDQHHIGTQSNKIEIITLSGKESEIDNFKMMGFY